MALQIAKVLRTLYRITKKILFYGFVSSFLYIIVGRFLMPPITIMQITNAWGYGFKRDYVRWDQIAPSVKLAAIASEDQSFTDHGGFDWDAIEHSLRPRKKGKKSKIPLGGGASTITQQVAKNVFLFNGVGIFRYVRKLPEIYFTKMIEWCWGKKRILEVYLNVIEMGPGIFGIEAAAGVKMLGQLFTQSAFAGRFGPNNYYFFYHTDRLLNSAITQRGFDLNVAFAASLFSAN